jgi:DNA-binding CsgD family transcriptional regulator
VLGAHRGRLDSARADAKEGLAAAEGHSIFRARNLWVIGFAELCTDNPDAALPSLEAAAALFDDAGALEPGMRLFTSDLLDAYLAAGRLEDAETVADALLARGAELGRLRATVIGARAKGLVQAAHGDLDRAVETLSAATRTAEAWPVPLEQGRTLMALGTIQRQARRRRDARATLSAALTLFERLGAPIFAQRAAAELGRIAGRTPIGQSLTPTEQRIADLVASGLTNREVARELVLATHSVESALTRIYGKLGVRSRSELARSFAGREAPGAG